MATRGVVLVRSDLMAADLVDFGHPGKNCDLSGVLVGVLIFDVNDFDEAYVGHFTWDLQRFAASIALMCWQKALSDEAITSLIETFVGAYIRQVRWFVDVEDDTSVLAEPRRPPEVRCCQRCSRPGCRPAPRCSTTSPWWTSAIVASGVARSRPSGR